MRAKVLVAVGEGALRRHLLRALNHHLPEALALEAAQAGLAHELALAELPDVVVVEAKLPGPFDGLSLIHRLRSLATFSEVPMLALVAPGASERRHQAFFVGASDVMSLPLDPVEFALRMRVHLRPALRQAGSAERSGPVRCGELTLDPQRREARWPGGQAQLTPAEFAILARLASRPGEGVDAEGLLVEALAKRPGLGNPQLIHTHVRNLRRKLELDPAKPKAIQRRADGYVFDLDGLI